MVNVRKTRTGARGGKYYIRNGKRVYVSGRTTRTTRHKSMMTGKQSKSPFFIDDVPTLI